MNAALEFRDGILSGPLRSSVNRSRDAKGSIHDDATATRLGFRGGTVAGVIHMELFPPLLLHVFGQRWFERGTLSTYFTTATTDREPVRAFLRMPPPPHNGVQVDAWIDREDGARVAEGTASAGDCREPTYLQRKLEARRDPGELRMLKGVQPGDSLPEVAVSASSETQRKRLDTITERLDWYDGASPWGASITTPAMLNQMLYSKPIEHLRAQLGGAVGLFGAIELRHLAGPVFVDRPYRVRGSVLSVGQSPKTEYMWYETTMRDERDTNVAGLMMLLRFMKASSSHYPELRAA